MGACQSNQTAGDVVERKPSSERLQGSRGPRDDDLRDSLASQTTGLSRESIDPCDYGKRKSVHESVKEYLHAEPTKNRVMVRIEDVFGPPIEEVYEGVHTGAVLGEGIAGKVRLITHRDTGIQRAVKRLDLSLVTSDEDLNRLLDEIKVMCSLDHPNVICLEEVFEGENELYLTQELCRGGDLFDRLDEQPDYCYTEARCAGLVKQIIASVSYLHSKDIIHRDLKLENFLFQDQSDQNLKMIDFGLSKHFVRGEILHEMVGTPYTVAPEVILGEGYDEKCDVWGIGVITYLLLSGDTPFGGASLGEDLNQVRHNILSGQVSFEDPVWETVTDLAIDFIKSVLKLDPLERPSSTEVKNHPWIKAMKRDSSSDSDEALSPKVLNGLVTFKELSSTRKFLAEIVSYTLQPEQISGLREEFEKIDVDGTGEISLEAFKEALIANSDCSEEEIEATFVGIHVRNTDMSIRWHEFVAACLSQCDIDDRNIRLAFDRLDTDRKGYVTVQDLKAAIDYYGGSDSHDLQRMWINSVIDYKSEKEHMTFDDFYTLLKLENKHVMDRGCGSLRPKHPPPKLLPRKSKGSLVRSVITQQESYDFLTCPVHDQSGQSKGFRSNSLGPLHDLDLSELLLDDKESTLITNMAIPTFKRRLTRDMQDFILEASKSVDEDEKGTQRRRTSITGKQGLILRREDSGREQ